jgi:hypothetical protein
LPPDQVIEEEFDEPDLQDAGGRFIAQQGGEPALDMGIALELMPVLDLWMMFPEIADEVAHGGAFAFYGAGTQGGSHPSQVALEGCLEPLIHPSRSPGRSFSMASL